MNAFRVLAAAMLVVSAVHASPENARTGAASPG